jgi:23S rRNA (uridine2552-2'-O)-methyltransferase
MKEHDVTKFDVIMSDAAPNTTGIKEVDAMRQIDLVHTILNKADEYLTDDGRFVAKVFMGP